MPDSATATWLHLTHYLLPVGTSLHRIHQACYGATQFNPGNKGNARFSPISRPDGVTIPTLYAGDTFDCAAMESVFHDVPFIPGFKSMAKSRLQGQVHSVCQTMGTLTLIDLRATALRKLGIERKQLIDTEKDQYPASRALAGRIHAQQHDAQGLLWTSRQDDSAKAVVLFGDRMAASVLVQFGSTHDLCNDQPTYEALLQLAERIGVNIVPAS